MNATTVEETRAPQSITTEVLKEKYCLPHETTEEEVFKRVAKAVAAVEKTQDLRDKWENEFFLNMQAGAIGAGRIMAAAGAENKATLINCFVQPVGDSAVGFDDDGLPGIYTALAQAGETLRRGGGVGFNFSAIRPKGALVKGTSSEASGPCTFMDVFDSSCKTVMAAGARRGAQMGILNIDHPDILEFIEAKRTKGRWNNFNVSVAVTDEFMIAVLNESEILLKHKAVPCQKLKDEGAYQLDNGLWVYKAMPAMELWNRIMKSAYDYAEPGIVFIDTMNKDNNLRAIEKIFATNPCGEQPLPQYGCCDLGPLNLTKYVHHAFTSKAVFDEVSFAASVRKQVRFLDNVLDATSWPLDEQHKESQSKRRIGVGFTGLGNALAMLNLRYDTSEGRAMAQHITEIMRANAYDASVDLAIERGSFPLFDADAYLEEGTFASRLPESVKIRIRTHGIRNSHLLSIAPTGTVSLAFADNASGGIEPPFGLAYVRNKRMPDGSTQKFPVVDHGLRVFLETLDDSLAAALLEAICNYATLFEHDGKTLSVRDTLPKSIVTALEMSCEDHLLMMAAVQPYIDTSISKTVNVSADYNFEDFKNLYISAYKHELKGVATYRPNDTLGSVLELPAAQPKAVETSAPVALDIDPLTVPMKNRPEGELASVTEKLSYFTSEGKKALYLVVSFDMVEGVVNGKPVRIERPVEVFIPANQNDGAMQWVTSVTRLLSLSARNGGLPKALADLMKVTWDKGPVRFGYFTKDDGTQVPRFHKSEVAAIAYAIQSILQRRGFLDEVGRVLAIDALTANADVGVQAPKSQTFEANTPMGVVHGAECQHCGAHAVVKRDGCEVCTNCNTVGSCG
jgi:ribonucleoside-diphosphate reductase alpha chain